MNDSISMRRSIPIPVFILDSATNPVAVVSKTSVNCFRM